MDSALVRENLDYTHIFSKALCAWEANRNARSRHAIVACLDRVASVTPSPGEFPRVQNVEAMLDMPDTRPAART